MMMRLFGVSSMLATTLFAGTTWDGGGGDNNWSTANNWDPDGTPSVGSGVDLTFAGTTQLTSNNNYTAWDDFRSILFASGAGAFTLTGNSLDLFGKIENNGSSTQTVSFSSFAFNSASAELNPVSGNLVINSVDIFTNGNTINVWGANGNTLTINGVISQGGGLTINQNSNVVLTGGNTFTGTTTISAGSLRIGDGGTTGTLGTGGVTNNAALVFNRSNDLSVSNTISGTGTLTKQGAGILTLSGANSYSGVTTINAGTLSISAENNLGSTPGAYVANQLALNGGTLKTAVGLGISTNRGLTIGSSGATLDNSTAGNGTNFNLNSKITGTGNLILKANGDTSDTGGGVGGNLTLGSTANDFIGNITIQSGIVNFASNASFGNAANTITIAGGGLVCTASSNSLAATRSVILAGGGNKIFRAYGSSTFTVNGPISGTGNVRHTDGGTLVLNGTNSFTGNIDNVGGNLTVGNSGHAGNISMFTGTLALTAGNTFTGFVHMRGANTVRLDADNALPDTATVLLYGGTTFNANGKTDTMGSLTTGSAADTSVIVNLGSGANLTVTGNSLPAGLTSVYTNATVAGKITGTGNLTYAHATTGGALWDWANTTNDFTGTITITQGRLRAASNATTPTDASLGNAANDIVFNGDIVATLGNGEGKASLQVQNGANLPLGAGRDVILNTGKEGTMHVWGGTTMTISGQVTGAGNLRKEDSGILQLNNTSNSYTGLTRIALGTIRVGVTGVIPDASGVEIAGGNLDLNAVGETAASLTGTGGAVTGGSTLTVLTSGSATYSGLIQNATTLHMAGTGTQTIAGGSDNANGWASVASGTLVLGKTSSSSVHAVGRSFGAGLTISGGTARLGGSGNDQIYTQADVSQSAGVFDLNGKNEGFRALIGTGGTVRNDAASTTSALTLGESSIITDSFTYSGAIVDGAGTTSLTKTGAGTQTLNGTNTYTGNTTINGGTLALGAGGSIASSSQIIVGATTTLDVTATGGWTVGASQTLSGPGTVIGNTTITGDLRPGSSPGTLTITGNLGLNSDSDLFIELGGTGILDFDRLLVSGQLSASGNILVSLVNSFNPAVNDSFQIATFTGFAGTGATFDFLGAPLDSGLSWDTSSFSTNGTITVIPEPASVLLAALGTLGLALRRRR
jgi:fibronectin-binding autotransporter adhesin